MKTKILVLGLLVAVFCLPGCNDEKDVTVSDIVVSPSAIRALEVGETVELEATITPVNATEEIRWEVYDTIVSIVGEGRKAILTAVSAGTTRFFATNKTGIVVSEEISVKVNSAEYATFVVGNYSGTAEIKGALNVNLDDVRVTLGHIEDENARMKLTLVADVPGMGELTITGDQVNASPGEEPETYTIKGVTDPLLPLMDVSLAVSGTYVPADRLLTLDLTAEGLSIHVVAQPGTPTDYAELVDGLYVGDAKLTGIFPADLSNVQTTLTRTGINKVSLAITGEAPGLGPVAISGEDITLSSGSQTSTCTFNGKALLPSPMEFELNVTGTFDMISQTLTLTLTEVNDMLAINLVAAPPGFDPSDYGARVEGQYLGSGNVTGALEADLSDVQITLERVDKELVKIEVTANVPGLNEVTLAGNAIEVSEGAGANTYALNGTATASIGEFSVTGTYNATEKTLAIKLAAAIAVIEVTAVKQE